MAKKKDKSLLSSKFIKDVNLELKSLEQETVGISNELIEMLEVDKDKLEVTEEGNDLESSQSLVNIRGKDKNNNIPMSQSINLKIKDLERSLASKIKRPVQDRLMFCKEVEFIEAEMPITKKSLSLFIDDVVSGGIVGTGDNPSARFDFYKTQDKSKNDETYNDNQLINILTANTRKDVFSDRISFFDIDRKAKYQACRDGFSIVAVYSHKQLATDIYNKYVLKEAKRKYADRKILKVISGKESLDIGDNVELSGLVLTPEGIDYMNTYMANLTGGETLINGDNVVHKLPKGSLDFIPEEFIQSREYTEYEGGTEHLNSKEESFMEFFNRYMNDDLVDLSPEEKIMSISPVSIPSDIRSSVCLSVSESLYTDDFVAVGGESVSKNLNAFDIEVLKKTSYRDIFAPTFRIGRNRKVFTQGESYYLSKLVDKVDKKVKSTFTMSGGEYADLSKQDIEDYKSATKSADLFRNVKGESSVVLEGHKTIPILIDNKIMGAFYIEYTELDIQEMSILRNIMATSTDVTSPEGTNVETTMSKVMLIEKIVKPIRDTLSANFIKNNTEIIGTINNILKEAEFYTASIGLDNPSTTGRIRFIPAENLVFYRNGDTGLGESRFQEASTYCHFYILALQSYLNHVMIDSRGFRKIIVKEGIDLNNNELLSRTIEDLDMMAPTRMSYRNIGKMNSHLGINNLYLTKSSNGDLPLEVEYEEGPESNIDLEFLEMLKVEATSIIGYSSSLFGTDSSELATKLVMTDIAKALDVINTQRHFMRSSSKLATMLLRYRINSNDVHVVYKPPVPTKLNLSIKKDIMADVTDIYSALCEQVDSIYGEDTPVSTAIKKRLYKDLYKELVPLDEFEKTEEDIELETELSSDTDVKKNNKKKEKEEDDEFGFDDVDNPFV
ncbi:MAG: hypothetical protein ACRCX2_15700 [Paraclostridium sp.]